MAYLNVPGGAAIWYSERPDSPSESYAGGVGKARRVFDVRWADRLRFLSRILGYSEPAYAANGTFTHVKRTPPVAYPPVTITSNRKIAQFREPDEYWLHASSVDSVEPVGIDRSALATRPPDRPSRLVVETRDSDNMFTHALARITVSYEALPYRVVSDNLMYSLGFQTGGSPVEYSFYRYVSRTAQPHAEHLTLPFGVLKWAPDAPAGLAGQVATNQTGKIIPTVELVVTWHQVPGYPEQAFKLIGTVNSATIYDYAPGTNKPFTYEAGTLLLTGMELKTYRMATGVYANDVVYRMKYFSAIDPTTGLPYSPARGHNYFLAFSAASGYSYEKLETNPTPPLEVQGVYQSSNFQDLFKLPNLNS